MAATARRGRRRGEGRGDGELEAMSLLGSSLCPLKLSVQDTAVIGRGGFIAMGLLRQVRSLSPLSLVAICERLPSGSELLQKRFGNLN
jgi:hypothetical protein